MHRIGVVGISWRHGSADALASLTIPKEERDARLPKLADAAGVKELVYLATCNRVEVAFASDGHTLAERGPPEGVRVARRPRAASRRGRAHAARLAGRGRRRASLPRDRRARLGARGRERDHRAGARGDRAVARARLDRPAGGDGLHRGAQGGEAGAAGDGGAHRQGLARAGGAALRARAPRADARRGGRRRRLADDRAVRAGAERARHRGDRRQPDARAGGGARERGGRRGALARGLPRIAGRRGGADRRHRLEGAGLHRAPISSGSRRARRRRSRRWSSIWRCRRT